MGCGSSTQSQPQRIRIKQNGHKSASTTITVADIDYEDFERDSPIKQNGTIMSTQNSKTTEPKLVKAPPPIKSSTKAKGEETLAILEIEDEAPDPRPPRTLKKDIVPDVSIFTSIDAHALKAPNNLRSSLKDMTNYLVKAARSPLEQVRAFWIWITHNVNYDASGYFGGTKKPTDPDSVLFNCSSVCQGYSELFAAFCKQMGIPVKVIAGHSKGYSYDPEKTITESTDTTHAWNAVFVNGDWRLLDCTWGAGHIDKSKNFERKYKEHYFLTDPEKFVADHLPFIEKSMVKSRPWQLLASPLDVITFSKNVNFSTTGKDWNVKPVTHSEAIINMVKEEDILVEAPDVPLDSFTVVFDHKNGDICKYYALNYKVNPSTLKVHLHPPKEGTYKLEIYGHDARDSVNRSHELLVSYIVRCKKADDNVRPYPQHDVLWGPDKEYDKFGFTDDVCNLPIIHNATNGALELRFNTSKEIPVTTSFKHSEETNKELNNFLMALASPGSLVFKVRCPIAGLYKLTVFAKKDWVDNGSFHPALTYLISCSSPAVPCKPFPRTYPTMQQTHSELLEPTDDELPPNTQICIKLRSALIKRLMVGGNIYKDKEGDTFVITTTTPDAGKSYNVFGSENESGNLNGLLAFNIV